jgi:hypothetical protein
MLVGTAAYGGMCLTTADISSKVGGHLDQNSWAMPEVERRVGGGGSADGHSTLMAFRNDLRYPRHPPPPPPQSDVSRTSSTLRRPVDRRSHASSCSSERRSQPAWLMTHRFGQAGMVFAVISGAGALAGARGAST